MNILRYFNSKKLRLDEQFVFYSTVAGSLNYVTNENSQR